MNYLASNQAAIAFGIIMATVAIQVLIFLPELRRLRITYPKGTVLESPKWLYLFGIGTILMACALLANAWLSVQSQPRLLDSAEFAQPYLHGKHLKLVDLTGDDNIIEGRTFEDCQFYGPAVIAITGVTTIHGNTFEAVNGQLFIPIIAGVHVGGGTAVIQLKDCQFRRCRFRRVQIVATQEEIDQWRRSAAFGKQ